MSEGAAAPPNRPLPKPGSARAWVLAIRPKTLTASLMPVVVGCGFAIGTWPARSVFSWPRAVAALTVGLGVQIATNLVNDVADFHRGADTHERVGPPRVTQLGLLSSKAVVTGAVVCILVAGFAGLWLAAVSSWWILAPGGLSLVLAVAYTAGPAPIAYLGLGELFVLAFFGVFATAGTAFVQAERIVRGSVIAGIAMGLLAVAILEANNIRDIPTDEKAGKRTLAVRLGERASRRLYVLILVAALLIGSSVLPWPFWLLLLVVPAPVVWAAASDVLSGATGRDMIRVLQRTSLIEFVYGWVLAILVAVTRYTGYPGLNVIRLIR